MGSRPLMAWRSHLRSLLLLLQCNVFPGVGVARRDRLKDILPFRCRNPGPDGIDESVAKHRHEIVILQDSALDLLRQPLTLFWLDRLLVALEFVVQLFDANHILGVEATAFE